MSVQALLPAAMFGTPATLMPSSSRQAVWLPSGENVRLPECAATVRVQSATSPPGTVPSCWAMMMPSSPPVFDHSTATWLLAGETSARLR